MLPTLQTALLISAITAIVAAHGATAGTSALWPWLHYAATPLATLCAVLLAATAPDPQSSRYRGFVVAGLVLVLAADTLLMLPHDRLTGGLALLLLAHLCFIAALLDRSNWAQRKVAFVAYALVASALATALFPTLPAVFKLPLGLYIGALALMAAQGASWMLATDSRAARLAALGGAWFMVSDATLALDRFRITLPYRDVLVLGTHWIALWCLARSVSRTGDDTDPVLTL